MLDALRDFARAVRAAFGQAQEFGPEDQLKGPVCALLQATGESQGRTVETATEVQLDDLAGRPDIGVLVDGLLCGHVELKRPGAGADPNRFRGRSSQQWEVFRDLPNLVYTDGSDWGLYRSGERVGALVRLGGALISQGESPVETAQADALQRLLFDFLGWAPTRSISTASGLAKLVAPLARLLKKEVRRALEDQSSALSTLAGEWRRYLFPDADDDQFADAYAQTLTYALMLVRLSGEPTVDIDRAAPALRRGHALLADTLKILGDARARGDVATSVSLLERVLSGLDLEGLSSASDADTWLYFYEDFLAAYDPRLRKDRGVFFTPVEVVKCQVRLVAELLGSHFAAPHSFADPRVTTLDPAAGTGTYLLAAIEHALSQVERERGPGMRATAVTTAARNVHAFEILVGPYAVAHLRLTQQILREGGELPADGVHVYLADTLESPEAEPPGHLPFMYQRLGEEHERARRLKARERILVCLGNPPYDRQVIEPEDQERARRKGGWVRYGDAGGTDTRGILADFLSPLEALGAGLHAKNLYNDYVYFWRWALWKVFQQQGSAGIVSFITASSYLRGPGFAGMRRMLRETFDELWILDLEGDSLGARKSENVFAIRTPVAIAVGVRYAEPRPDLPARVHYCRLDGTRAEKLRRLAAIRSFSDVAWREVPDGWPDCLIPAGRRGYWSWPRVEDLFPSQENGVQFKRTWPIGESVEVLERRWRELLRSKDRGRAFKETRDRKVDRACQPVERGAVRKPAIASLRADAELPEVTSYAYRFLDRRNAILDERLADFIRPTLIRAHSPRQVYLVVPLGMVLGRGPGALATELVPDLHCFRGSFGGKHVLPLWLDRDGESANVDPILLCRLSEHFGRSVSAEELFCYAYAILASPAYVDEFWDELSIPGPRLPITRDREVFAQVAEAGRELVWLHTFGYRMVPKGTTRGRVPPGRARCLRATPSSAEDYPASFSYDGGSELLEVGGGSFSGVAEEVFAFQVSGYEVLPSWLSSRMADRTGRRSSDLDDIRPERWEFDGELLELIWVLEHTLARYPALEGLLRRVLDSELWSASSLPPPGRHGSGASRAREVPAGLYAEDDAS